MKIENLTIQQISRGGSAAYVIGQLHGMELRDEILGPILELLTAV